MNTEKQQFQNEEEIPVAKVYHLEPGYVYVNAQGAVIRTVVGSCVTVCLWDTQRRLGGMNHFMYPIAGKTDKRTVVYGDVAMPVLIRLMKDFGSDREKLVAQLYGGGCQFGDEKRGVGPKNVDVARSILEEFRIPLITQDTGGRMGRKILFDTATGEAAVLKVHALRRDDWYHPKKKRYGVAD